MTGRVTVFLYQIDRLGERGAGGTGAGDQRGAAGTICGD
jgi:hypothetical protein